MLVGPAGVAVTDGPWMRPEYLSEPAALVYRDLRRRGWWVGSATGFGVDFLVYPGDPLCFHAQFMVMVRRKV